MMYPLASLSLLLATATASLVITEVADKGDPTSSVPCGLVDYIELCARIMNRNTHTHADD